MQYWILASIVSFATSAFATDLSPKLGSTLCLQRVYTKSELKKSPGQKLSEVSIQVAKSKTDDGSDTFQTAIVIGRSVKNGKLYGNTAWHAGNNKYQIDCDGGSFALVPRSNAEKEWVNFEVTPNYYFPLFREVLQPDLDKMGDAGYEIHLSGDDSENNVWRLEEVPAVMCTDKIQQVQNTDGGC